MPINGRGLRGLPLRLVHALHRSVRRTGFYGGLELVQFRINHLQHLW
jgi:hypothetical protein